MFRNSLFVLALFTSPLALAQANTALSNLTTTAINQDLNFAILGSYGTHYVGVTGFDNLVIQTGPADGSGFGGGLNLTSGNSVQISAGGNGGFSLSTAGADIDISPTGGDVVLTAGSNNYVDAYGDSLYVATQYGLQLSPQAAAPTCSSSRRGTLYYLASAGGVADQLQVCVKAADDTYSWQNVSF